MLLLASYLAENTRPTYERIAAWLTARLGEPASLLGGMTWEKRVAMLDDGRVHAAFICGWSYVQRHDRPEQPVDLLCAPVMAPPRYEDRPIYFTDVVVRHDSPLWSFVDLRDQTYAYNDRGSHSGYNVPRDHLLRLGETRGYFGRTVASGSHQTSIRMVESGEVDASGIDSTVLDVERRRRPELSATLRTVAVLGPSPIPPVIVTRVLPENQRERLRAALLAMHEDAEGRAILGDGLIARFVRVRDADYDPIRAMVARAVTAGFLELR
ncbi:MAG: phosphate/phosphite/phosphonate ABC transporter substrate-binding protein [Candidatus Rokuibacteriota bacterium]